MKPPRVRRRTLRTKNTSITLESRRDQPDRIAIRTHPQTYLTMASTQKTPPAPDLSKAVLQPSNHQMSKILKDMGLL